MVILSGVDVQIQEAQAFVDEIIMNEAIVGLWGEEHVFDEGEVRKVAMKFAQEYCDRRNSCCRCDNKKGTEPSGELHGVTERELFAKFRPAEPLDRIKKDSKRRKTLQIFLREFTKTEDGYVWNECPRCGRRWPYELPERHLKRSFMYKTATDRLSEDIFQFIDYLNRYTINPTGPLYIEDIWPDEAIDNLRHRSTHICLVPLQVIYYYAHIQREKFEKPEQIFELEDLSQPKSEYYGRFRPELEEVLVNKFGICEAATTLA